MTNWEKYFSTPEKAANTLDFILIRCQTQQCYKGCPLDATSYCIYAEDKTLEWLQEEAS